MILVGWSYPADVRRKLVKALTAEKQILDDCSFELRSGEPDNRPLPLVIDEQLEEFNDEVEVDLKDRTTRQRFIPELLRRRHIYSKYQKKFYSYRTGNPEDWAEVHICTVRRFMNGKIFMFDNQTDKPKQLFSVIDLIPFIPWYHSVYKLQFMDDVELPNNTTDK